MSKTYEPQGKCCHLSKDGDEIMYDCYHSAIPSFESDFFDFPTVGETWVHKKSGQRCHVLNMAVRIDEEFEIRSKEVLYSNGGGRWVISAYQFWQEYRKLIQLDGQVVMF